ncbi:hypothetical protein RchiOBHm_Chr6g0280951 [Rosa chinensis]|uniref:Uncharacterized protein n=1 Tax=Rosa chinensis TaxID=74649 RepID=A0A2P6PTE3_ROSCH|nr:hypothetical protein RchiOBHm_Chr6g0280951 [Rosa chinensis]
MVLGPIRAVLLLIFSLFGSLVAIYFLLLISPDHVLGWKCGLRPGLRTLRAMSALGRRRVPYFVKWSQPLSGRMKLSVTELYFQWQHTRKADSIGYSWLQVSIIFSVCHHNCKANGVARRALFAKGCMLECIFIDETLVIISGGSLEAYCNLGLRHYVLQCILRFH